LHRLFGVHVYRLHEPARCVGADGQQRQIDTAEHVRDIAEATAIAGVAGKIEPEAIDIDDPATPQRTVAVGTGAAAEMLRGHEERFTLRVRRALPPAQLDQIVDAAFAEPVAHAFRNIPGNLFAETAMQGAHT